MYGRCGTYRRQFRPGCSHCYLDRHSLPSVQSREKRQAPDDVICECFTSCDHLQLLKWGTYSHRSRWRRSMSSSRLAMRGTLLCTMPSQYWRVRSTGDLASTIEGIT